MTVLDDSPRSTYAPRLQRRHEIVTTGGMDGVLCVGDALRECGYPVRDFTVEVHDGVPYSSVLCTVSVTADESETFTERIGALPAVVSVGPY
ncbi:hypothetical protein [Pseudonocardia humida]|uniref:ACT domain-containing protein n=1 Tax=Pseudonocardia humida TaxID=2800819 RepID=A0ABT0ZYM5_9PSEU|nr:hypothetical protein [Pseudonocardia humida]MCO1655838.1 hypothetical protein [Pseudonocardia humida]